MTAAFFEAPDPINCNETDCKEAVTSYPRFCDKHNERRTSLRVDRSTITAAGNGVYASGLGFEKDDTIDFETENGTYRYAVQSTKIVTPRDVSVLNASGAKTLTLVTCYPFYYVGSAPKRFIVRAIQLGNGASKQEALAGRGVSPPG